MLKKTAAGLFLITLLQGCDNSSSDTSSTPAPPPSPVPTPVYPSKPVATDVSISNDNGTLTGSYRYTNEDGKQEGHSQLYWKNSTSLLINGNQYSLTAKDLNIPVDFCVVPVTFDGIQGEQVCSSLNVTAIPLTTSNDFPTTIPDQLKIYKNVNIIPESFDDYNLQMLDIGFQGDVYIKGSRSDYDGYNLNDIGIYTNESKDLMGLSNYTPRTILNPVIRVKLKSDHKNSFFYFKTTLAPFSTVDTDNTKRPFTVSDVEEAQFIDPNPLYRNQIDHFVSPEDTDDIDPNDNKWIPIPTSNDVFGYNKIMYYQKYFNNRLSTLNHFIDYFTAGNETTYDAYRCSKNNYAMCGNSDFSIHAWSRTAKSEVNAKYYFLQNTEASGLSTVGGRGLLMLGLAPYAVSLMDDIFEHEHEHNLGYNHDSGMTYGWPNEFASWIRNLPYFDFVDNANTQTLTEDTDYTYSYEWQDNKNVKITFMSKYREAEPLTSLAILAEDEQDPSYIHSDTTYVGIPGHENNNFSVESVYQISPSTILVTLKNPMRYMGNSLAVYAEPTYSKASTGYVSLIVNNSNDITIDDAEVGALIVNRLDPDYKAKAFFNGSTGFVGLAHVNGVPTNSGLDDAVGGVNYYNLPLDKYQLWDIPSAIDVCIKAGKKGLAKINTSPDSISALQNKYLVNSSIIALDENNEPKVFAPGDQKDKGQLIACSRN